MNKLHAILTVLFVCLLGLAGCSGSNNMTPPPGSATVSLTARDTPPAGAGILSFEVTLTGAILNPGAADLLNGKTPRIEVEQLETDAAFLNTAKVAPGTFTSISLTFSNPEVTFQNNTGAPLAGCAVGAVCEIKPTGPLTSMFTFPGSGIAIGPNSGMGLQVDINPNVILQADMSVNFSLSGATTVTQLAVQPNNELEELNDIRGTVQNLDMTNQKFDLKTIAGTFTITTNANTEFEFGACVANNFTCLANGLVVEVDAMLQTSGAFLAKKIELEDQVEDDEIEGVIFKIDDPTHFELAVLDELHNITNVSIGNPVIVTLNGAHFEVDADVLTVPSALLSAFDGATDTSQLIPGQVVEIRLTAPANPGPPITVTTDRVRLRMTQFTAQVSITGSPNFTVNNLPSFFTPASSVHVQTQSATEFEGVAGASALAIGDTVSLKGLLFAGATPATPELIAAKVRKR